MPCKSVGKVANRKAAKIKSKLLHKAIIEGKTLLDRIGSPESPLATPILIPSWTYASLPVSLKEMTENPESTIKTICKGLAVFETVRLINSEAHNMIFNKPCTFHPTRKTQCESQVSRGEVDYSLLFDCEIFHLVILFLKVNGEVFMNECVCTPVSTEWKIKRKILV